MLESLYKDKRSSLFVRVISIVFLTLARQCFSFINCATENEDKDDKVLTHFLAHLSLSGGAPARPALSASRPALLRQVDVDDAPAFLRQLGPGLRVRVVHGEVGDDDGNGEGDREYTALSFMFSNVFSSLTKEPE